ncbi:MAG TPA: carboxymuconolactone decarboxylase family protein [Ktedonobacterales bacterium]
MPRIQPLNSGDVDPEMQEIFARYQQERGNTPNMFRTMAYRPEIAATADAHLQAIFNTGTVGKRLKEMLAVRVSQINDCAY